MLLVAASLDSEISVNWLRMESHQAGDEKTRCWRWSALCVTWVAQQRPPPRAAAKREKEGKVKALPTACHITYQLQYRKCGKASCTPCRNGQGHGPYWYAYWRENHRLRSGYVGKVHPALLASSVPATEHVYYMTTALLPSERTGEQTSLSLEEENSYAVSI